MSRAPEGRLRRSVGWSYVMDGGRQILTAIITAILAMMLGPSAFGVVAMAVVYVLFIEMVLQQGLIAAIVQRPSLETQHVTSAFWMTLVASVVLMSVSLALSGWWADVNDTPQLSSVINWLSALIPLKGLTLVQEAILRRRMAFRSLALRTNGAELSGGVVGIACAFAGFGVWSLVAQQISRRIVEVAVLWSVSDWRPSLRFSRAHAVELLSFSSGSFLGSVAVFVNNRADALLIGLYLGPTAVGLYRFALRFVDLVVDGLVRSLVSVSLPELSRLQADRVAFSARLATLVHFGSALALPALGVLAATAPRLMAVIGPEWQPAARPLQILCVVGGVRTMTMFTGPMLQALGRPFLQASLAWVVAVISAATFVAAGMALQEAPIVVQVSGIALSRAVVYGGAVLGIVTWLLGRYGGVRARAFLGIVWPGLAAGGAAVAAGAAVEVLALSLPPLAAATLVGGTAATTAAVVLWVADQRVRQLVADHGPAVLARRHPGRVAEHIPTGRDRYRG